MTNVGTTGRSLHIWPRRPRQVARCLHIRAALRAEAEPAVATSVAPNGSPPPIDKDLYDLPPQEAKNVKSMCRARWKNRCRRWRPACSADYRPPIEAERPSIGRTASHGGLPTMSELILSRREQAASVMLPPPPLLAALAIAAQSPSVQRVTV